MSTTGMSNEAQKFYDRLKDLEAKGGSAGYKTNPSRFQAYADEIYASKSEDDILVDRLEFVKSLNGQQGALNKLKLLVAVVKRNGDPLVSGLAAKLEGLQDHLRDGAAFDAVIKDAKGVAETRRGPKAGYNQRVFENLELVEKLGGSEGFKKYLEKRKSGDAGTTTGGKNPSDPFTIDDGESAPAILRLWVSGTVASLSVDSEIAACRGTGWAFNLNWLVAWGTLTINKKDLEDLVVTYETDDGWDGRHGGGDDRPHPVGNIITPYVLGVSGDHVGARFYDEKHRDRDTGIGENIFAIFQGEESTLSGDGDGYSQGVAVWKVKLDKFFHRDFMKANIRAF